MRRGHLLSLLLALTGCTRSSSPTIEGIRLGMNIEALYALHPDLRERPLDDDSVAPAIEEGLGESDGASDFERGPDGELVRQYFRFRDGELRSYAAAYGQNMDPAELRAALEADQGAPTSASSLGTSNMAVWERPNYTINLLSFGDGSTRDHEIRTIVFLQAPPKDSLVLLGLILGMLGLGVLNLLTARQSMRAFHEKIQSIETTTDMDAFKRAAGRSMYGALVQVVLLLVPNLVWAWAWSESHLSWESSKIVIFANGLVVGAALLLKPAEERVKSCAVSEALRAEKEHVLQVWKSRPLPRF